MYVFYTFTEHPVLNPEWCFPWRMGGEERGRQLEQLVFSNKIVLKTEKFHRQAAKASMTQY